MWWIVTAVAFLLFAGLASIAELVYQSRWQAIARGREATCAELDELAATARSAGGGEFFADVVQVNGVTAEGPGEPLVAPLSGRKCVWWEFSVSRVYWQVPKEQSDKAKPTRQTHYVTGGRSEERFLVQDETGSVAVSMGNDRPEGTTSSHHAAYARKELTKWSVREIPKEVLDAAAMTRDDSSTISYRIDERILPPGVPLFVHGEATDRAGQVVIGRPRKGGRLIVSVIGRNRLIADYKQNQRLARAGRIALLVIAGLSLLFYGLTLVF
ncbi:GIDE domain-containing protein [Herbidospora daliensis]|uniref:GIDE domain-containing protein n=1 Tax=Herbidospora daliensis TaxID=295585 RepID=UPI000780A065|nr:GIDE domain-containing protein [Herbidospora daliensis]